MKPTNGTPILSVTLEDCEVQTFTAGGPGGQHQNRSRTGVRIVHRDSGARGESREQRSQLQNKRAAFRRMAETVEFTRWLSRKLMTGPTSEERVAQDMAPENLRIETRVNGRWTPLDEAEQFRPDGQDPGDRTTRRHRNRT